MGVKIDSNAGAMMKIPFLRMTPQPVPQRREPLGATRGNGRTPGQRLDVEGLDVRGARNMQRRSGGVCVKALAGVGGVLYFHDQGCLSLLRRRERAANTASVEQAAVVHATAVLFCLSFCCLCQRRVRHIPLREPALDPRVKFRLAITDRPAMVGKLASFGEARVGLRQQEECGLPDSNAAHGFARAEETQGLCFDMLHGLPPDVGIAWIIVI
jgi:hypothetical protein